MNKKIYRTRDIIADLLYNLGMVVIFPLIGIFGLISVFIFTNSVEIKNYIVFSGVIGILFPLFVVYRRNYNLILNYSLEVGYVHFKPSNKDILVQLLTKIITTSLTILILIFLLGLESIEKFDLTEILIFSSTITSILFVFTVVLTVNSKNKLIKTAMEPLDDKLLNRLKSIPNFNKISEFRFADIKPASLFLSAGVTKFQGRKNICLVSRYFQWKLTEDELFSVLAHEIGHINNNDLKSAYLLMGTDFLIRILFYSSILIGIKFAITQGSSISILLICLLNIGLIILSGLLLSFIMRYRIYNQEINSDKFGSEYSSNFQMASTLKKLPSVIPAPVDDNPLEFLGFRIAILKNRGKSLNEKELSEKKIFSRFSNN